MDLHKLSSFDNHEFVISINDKENGLKAFIAVHSRNLGIAHGGTRLKEYSSEKEALEDVLELSQAMSYKSALADLPYGGAKAVIMSSPSINKKSLLKSFAKKVDSLGGLFHTGTDVGLTDEDVKYMKNYCSYMLGVGNHEREGLTTSTAAAIGVFLGIKAALKHSFGSEKLEGRTVGIKGIGKLGSALAKLLYGEGAKVIVADIDEHKTKELADELPDIEIADVASISSRELDVYAPCALGHEFTSENVKNLKCKIIAGGANNQLLDEKVGDALFNQGILYAPDFVINVGGLIFVSEDLEKSPFSIKRINRRLLNIPDVLINIFQLSTEKRTATNRVAISLAKEKILHGGNND